MTIRAIFSLANKDKRFLEFATALMSRRALIAATAGTYKAIRTAPSYRQSMDNFLQPVHDLTGFREAMGGSIKTLSPYLHAALQTQALQAEVNGKLFPRIDLLCVTLRPHDDVGGPALILSALKGRKIIVTNAAQCATAMSFLTPSGGPPDAVAEMWNDARKMLHRSICEPMKSNVVPLRRP